jgi:signal transduction histidine kinase
VKLRARLIATVLLVAVPASIGVALYARSMRRQALIESLYEATLARMEERGRDRCERRPERFARMGRVREVYDHAYRPLVAEAPPLDPELRAELEDGETVASREVEGHLRVAMRMPWDGPCAILVVERRIGPMAREEGPLRTVSWATLIAALTALVALIAVGPLVRRLRKLAKEVRSDADVSARGSDEIAELGRAFNEARAQIKAQLAEVSARDEALTEFLASTTHDVMVPLTVLQGHLSDLRRDARDGKAVDAEKLSSALEEAHYLGALVRNLSAAARLDAGEPMLTRHTFDLRGIVERVIARHRPIADERGIELAFAVPEEPIEIVADSTLAEQAISNLVHNAVRYNRAGGHVAVVLEARSEASVEGFTLRVADDGPGIPADELARVGERRFRGGAARKRRPTGLGLGLHIVRDVADRHAWRLVFEAPPEGGLSVRIEGRLAGIGARA